VARIREVIGTINSRIGSYLALTAVQFFIGNFVDPCVMGSSLNLSPFAILVSPAVWS
jgi:predicted PurR-regulated permease PerM